MEKSLLNKALKEFRANNPDKTYRDMGEELGIPSGSVHRFLSGDHDPRESTLLPVLKRLGWRLERARPDYDPAVEVLDAEGEKIPETKRARLEAARRALAARAAEKAEPRTRIRNLGRVAAGDASVAFDVLPGEGPEEFLPGITGDTLDDLFEAQGRFLGDSLFALTVAGTSMEPTYPDHSMLVCRHVSDPASVPDGADVIFRERNRVDHYSFKRLTRLKTGERVTKILGMPMNREHALLQWEPNEVEIYAVVLGAVVFAPWV